MLFPGFSARGADFQTTQVRRTQENSPVRQHWEPHVGNVSPGTGRKNPPTRIFRPVPGLTNCQWRPTGCAPWAGIFRPSGSFAKHAVCGLPQCGAAYSGCGPAFQRVQPAESRLRAELPAPQSGKPQTLYLAPSPGGERYRAAEIQPMRDNEKRRHECRRGTHECVRHRSYGRQDTR
jgi:hypothetical protein